MQCIIKLMHRNRSITLHKLVAVQIGAVLSVAAVPSLMKFATAEAPVQPVAPDEGVEAPLINGMMYSLSELECRGWHRNRTENQFASQAGDLR